MNMIVALVIALLAWLPLAPDAQPARQGGPTMAPMAGLNSFTGKGFKVTMVGDSITNYSTPELTAALASYRRSVTGVPGISLLGALDPLVRPAVATKPHVVVVELGINSAREAWNSADLKWLEATLTSLDKATRVIWITPSALAPSYYDHLGKGTLQARLAAFKASLVKRLPAHPKQRLADFSKVQLKHPEWFDDDHLHPSDEGKVAFAEYVAAQVDAVL